MPIKPSNHRGLVALSLSKNPAHTIYVTEPGERLHGRPSSLRGKIPPTRGDLHGRNAKVQRSSCPPWPDCLNWAACVVNEEVNALNGLLDALNRMHRELGELPGPQLQMFLRLFDFHVDSLRKLVGLHDLSDVSKTVRWPLVPCSSQECRQTGKKWVTKEYGFTLRPAGKKRAGQEPEIFKGRILFAQDCVLPATGGVVRSRGYITNFTLVAMAPTASSSSSSSSRRSSSQPGC